MVEEKSGWIVEILLACVRPSSLLAGRILGIGVASVMTTGFVAVTEIITTKTIGIMSDTSLNLDGVLTTMPVWMIADYAIFAVTHGATASLMSRREDVSSMDMPLLLLAMVPYMLSLIMATGNPNSTIFRVLPYLPLSAPFMVSARPVLGVSPRAEQLITLGIMFVFLPLLVHGAAAIYTRAVTHANARISLKEVLGRAGQA